MTKESVKKTEVIEKTVSESFTVCDSCGMETEHAAEFTSRGDSMTLHFCKSCLDKDELIIQGRDIEEDQSSIGAIILGGMLSASVVGFVGLGLLGPLFGIIVWAIMTVSLRYVFKWYGVDSPATFG